MSTSDTKFVTGGNIVTLYRGRKILSLRAILGWHLLAAVITFPLAMLGFWTCAPVWHLGEALESSAWITVFCNGMLTTAWIPR